MIRSTLALAHVAPAMLLLSAWSASAQGAPPAADPAPGHAGHKAMAACRGDMATLCAGVERGGGRKIKCLKDNQAKLSPGCQSAIQNVLDQHGAGAGPKAAAAPGEPGAQGPSTPSQTPVKIKQACQSDIATVCVGVAPGQGGIAKCLKQNAGSLSPACSAALAQRKEMTEMLKKTVKDACAADRQTLCGAEQKGHAVMACLREKQAQVSPPCQQAIAGLRQGR